MAGQAHEIERPLPCCLCPTVSSGGIDPEPQQSGADCPWQGLAWLSDFSVKSLDMSFGVTPTSSVNLDMFLNLSVCQFLHLLNEANNNESMKSADSFGEHDKSSISAGHCH
jgi:hypothetical protein